MGSHHCIGNPCRLCWPEGSPSQPPPGGAAAPGEAGLVSALAKCLRAFMSNCAHCAEVEGYCGGCYEASVLLEQAGTPEAHPVAVGGREAWRAVVKSAMEATSAGFGPCKDCGKPSGEGTYSPCAACWADTLAWRQVYALVTEAATPPLHQGGRDPGRSGEEERRDVVAWLYSSGYDGRRLAEAIERGDHVGASNPGNAGGREGA